MTKELYLKNLIERQYSSVKAFSIAANIPYTTVRSILERGVEKANVNNIIKICSILGITTEQLINSENLNEQNITIVYNQLDQERQTKVYNFAESELHEQNKAKNSLLSSESENMMNYSNHNVITLYGAVSAGTGEYLEDNATWEVEFKGDVPQHDFALRVNGDSMQPLFKDNDIIFVKKEITDYNNKIVVASLNGDGYVKKFVKTKKETKLVSLNKKYKDVIVTDDDCLEVFGIVIK